MISRWTEVDWLPQIDLILEVKFGSEPLFGAGECLKKELILNPTQIMERYDFDYLKTQQIFKILHRRLF